jgi:transposase
MGRPLGKAAQLEERRRQAVAMVDGGLAQTEVARRLKVSARTVRKWLAWHRGRGSRRLKARPTPGRPAQLGRKELARLAAVLLKGARAAGYATDLWSGPRVMAVIRREFGVTYNISHIPRLLRKMGWSPQRPERRAIERDEGKILGWKRRTWSRIKKKLNRPEPQ